MKYSKCYLAGIAMLILFVTSGIGVFAINTGFTAEELPEKDRNTFLSNINLLILKEEPPKRTISCFDVNEEGLIAVGCND